MNFSQFYFLIVLFTLNNFLFQQFALYINKSPHHNYPQFPFQKE